MHDRCVKELLQLLALEVVACDGSFEFRDRDRGVPGGRG